MLAENASSSSKEDFAVSPTSKRRSNSVARAGAHLAHTEWPDILSYYSPICCHVHFFVTSFVDKAHENRLQ
jgi:hypothetical protein